MAAVASQPNPSAYPSQLRAAKYSASSRLQHSPPSKTAILALHRYTNDRPSKCHCHRAPASGSQRSSTDFSRNSRSWLQRQTNSQPQYLHVQNLYLHKPPIKPLLDNHSTPSSRLSPPEHSKHTWQHGNASSCSISLIIFRSLNFLYSQ